MTGPSPWQRYQDSLVVVDGLGFTLDVSRMNYSDAWLREMEPKMTAALASMKDLEAGAVANPDEKRMVGHYWLRAPELAPAAEATRIREALAQLKSFVADIHAGRIKPEGRGRFTHILIVGIGGSALGPQLATDALGTAGDRMSVSFFDNTDPDGFDRTIGAIGDRLAETLIVVISKSGGTKETRNGMLEATEACKRANLRFEKHAVAITGVDSELHHAAASWLARFPMWDWIGGRTSELSVVGLLPAALQGINIDDLLAGARDMDRATRQEIVTKNPAAMLALMWHHASEGRGAKDLVVLPYKDRLLLLSRYLQQLIMESLGKEFDLHGQRVNQGLTVYGNKGSTDQHAYIQQLRDGVSNFFALFVEVLVDRHGPSYEVESSITSGDYLLGFLLGTRSALYEKARESITLTITDVSPRSLGGLIALFERAVGLYASLISVNAYHQPGVEAGKKAATHVLSLQRQVIHSLSVAHAPQTALVIASNIAAERDVEIVFKILEHLAANGRVTRIAGERYTEAKFQKLS